MKLREVERVGFSCMHLAGCGSNFLRYGRRVLLTGRVHIIARPVYIGALMGKLITGTPGAVLGAFGSRNTVSEFR